VSRIYASEDLPDCIVLHSPGGDVTVLDIDLATQKGEWKSHVDSPLLASYMFPKASASFLPAHPVAPLATLVLLFSSASSVQVCVLSIHGNEVTTVLDESIAVDGTVIEASCSASGHISCLQSDGQWRSFELAVASPGLLSLLPISSPLRLAGLSFIKRTFEAAASQSSSSAVSILSLGSSLVLLCSGITQSQDLVLLLWDLRYSVVLASHRFSIPSQLSTSKGSVSLELIPALNSLALLSVSSGPLTKVPKPCSAVLAVPVTVPTTSTIANAMGRASSSAKWIVKSDALTNGHVPYASFDSDHRDLFDKLKAALRQNNPEAADSAFFEWLKNRSGSAATVDTFGHEFVREILDIVLQTPSKSAATLYPAKTVHHLLENRLLSASMLSQSLLGFLAERKDWRAIELAFRNVPDLPENEVIKLLCSVPNDGRPHDTQDMQVGATSSDTPTLPSILAACVSYPTSDAALRMAIREHLNLAGAIIPILAILDDWLVNLSSHGTNLILNASAGESGPLVVVPPPCSRKVEIPPADKILAFLRAILDATFVTLLQHTGSHQLLRRFASHLQSELSIIDDLQLLHGPLGLFAKAQEKTQQRPPVQLEDWRRRRKLAHERASMGVSLYQVEELVI
jgi:hypothetical protein